MSREMYPMTIRHRGAGKQGAAKAVRQEGGRVWASSGCNGDARMVEYRAKLPDIQTRRHQHEAI